MLRNLCWACRACSQRNVSVLPAGLARSASCCRVVEIQATATAGTTTATIRDMATQATRAATTTQATRATQTRAATTTQATRATQTRATTTAQATRATAARATATAGKCRLFSCMRSMRLLTPPHPLCGTGTPGTLLVTPAATAGTPTAAIRAGTPAAAIRAATLTSACRSQSSCMRGACCMRGVGNRGCVAAHLAACDVLCTPLNRSADSLLLLSSMLLQAHPFITACLHIRRNYG